MLFINLLFFQGLCWMFDHKRATELPKKPSDCPEKGAQFWYHTSRCQTGQLSLQPKTTEVSLFC